MSKFVVAYISFFDNILEQDIVEAVTSIEAMLYVLGLKGFTYGDLIKSSSSEEDVKMLAFNSDSMISAIEIPT